MIIFLTGMCALLVYLTTKPHCPKYVPDKSQDGTIEGDMVTLNLMNTETHQHEGWVHSKKHYWFDPLNRNLELWMKIEREMSMEGQGMETLLDGYVEVYAAGKTCAYGKCPRISQYDLDIGVNKRCKKCPYQFYSGESSEHRVETEKKGKLVPAFDHVEACDAGISAHRAHGLVYVTKLDPEIKQYSNCSLFINIGKIDGLALEFFVAEQAGIIDL